MTCEITLDIETVPDQTPGAKEAIAAGLTPPGNISKAETIAKWMEETRPILAEEAWRKTALDGAAGQIVVASLAINDAPPLTFFDEAWQTAEVRILKALFAAIEDATGGRALAGGGRAGVKPLFIGHCLVDFDLRFIFQRAVIHGIQPPACIPFNAKPWGDEVFDTMTQWAGAKGRIKLDRLCRTLGIATKGHELDSGDDIDGSKVWDFVKAGRIVEVADYCAGDVERARQAYKRMTFQV